MNQKGFAPVLILVVVALVAAAAGGAYYFGRTGFEFRTGGPATVTIAPTPTPKQDEAATWKIYTNKEHGYDIKHPSNFFVEISKESRWHLSFDSVDFRNYPKEEEWVKRDAVSISIKTTTPGENVNDLQKWLEKVSTGPRVDGTTGPDARDFSPYKVGNIDALSFKSGGERFWKHIAFLKDGKLFMLSLNPTDETGSSFADTQNAEKVFHEILSTFRFD